MQVGATYFLELWCSDVGSVNTGVTSAYIDLDWNAGFASAVSIDHSGLYTVFTSGAIADGFIDELGGSTVQQVAIEPEWVRVVVVEINADLGGDVNYTSRRSSTGVAAWDRGMIAWPNVRLDSIAVTHICSTSADCDDGINCTIDTCDPETSNISLFVSELLADVRDPILECMFDLNRDDLLDGLDVQPFVDGLLN